MYGIHPLGTAPASTELIWYEPDLAPANAGALAPAWRADRRRKKREERIAREMLARQQHAEASAIARAGGVALHRPWRPGEQAEKDARQQAIRAQQMAEAAAQEAIEKARQAAEKARSQRIRLLVCAALVMDN